jgi:lipopolysaccharide export LptBFGC system permease protein LptF
MTAIGQKRTLQRSGMHIKYTLFSLLVCLAVGGAAAAFTSLSWLAATCFILAALLINGALATLEDSRPGGFDNPDGTGGRVPAGPILTTVAIAVGVLLLGAWIQIG